MEKSDGCSKKKNPCEEQLRPVSKPRCESHTLPYVSLFSQLRKDQLRLMKVPTHAHRRYLQDKQKEIYRLVTVTIATGRK